MDEHMAAMERSLRRTRLLAAGVAAVVLLLVGYEILRPPPTGVIRARGIVVVDDEGRERILIGAPIPAAANRVRTDTARVREIWAGRFPDPDQYMGYYAEYDHDVNGILVLDENGFDRLALGAPTPDPNIGQRIGPATGLQINDAEGFERSGYGLLTVDGTDRVVLGLDSNEGTEALTLWVRDGGSVGMRIASDGETLFLGGVPDGIPGAETAPPKTGLAILRGDSLVYSAGSPGE